MQTEALYKHPLFETHILAVNARFTIRLFLIFRAIYRWTAATGGVKQCFENNPSANTAEEYITKFQSGKISHAQILQLLCM